MPWSNYITPAIRNLVLACTAVFLIQTLLNLFDRPLSDWMTLELGLVPVLVTHALHLWQPVTYLFLHGGLHAPLVQYAFSVDVWRGSRAHLGLPALL